MEKMFTLVSSAEGSDLQDTLAQQMESVCAKLPALYTKTGIPANQQHDLFNQVLSCVKRALRFALPSQQDNDKIMFLEFCLAPFVSKVPEECKKMCLDLVTRHVSQNIDYRLDDGGDVAMDALMTALGSDAYVARVYSVQPTPSRRRSRPSLSQSSLLSARASPVSSPPMFLTSVTHPVTRPSALQSRSEHPEHAPPQSCSALACPIPIIPVFCHDILAAENKCYSHIALPPRKLGVTAHTLSAFVQKSTLTIDL
jgi:hypothetical protein